MRQDSESWSAIAEPGAVSAFRHHISAFAAAASIPERPLNDVRLAVSEGVANAVVHGYRDRGAPGPVDMTATLDDGRLRIVILDEGVGMRSRSDSPGVGLGLPIIKKLAKRCEVRPHRPHGTELHLLFDLERPS